MNELKTLKQQIADGQAGLKAFELMKQQAFAVPENCRSKSESALVDYYSRSFEQNLNTAQAHHRDRITPEELSKCLGLYRKALKALPLTASMPYEKTAQGFRQVLRYSREDVANFLQSLNSTYTDFDFTEVLVSPKDAVELLKECGVVVTPRKLAALRNEGGGPEYVQLSPRVTRYRVADILAFIQNPEQPKSISELIMES